MTQLIQGPHLLYVAGEGVDFGAIQKIIDTVPHFNLGPFCWLVRPPQRDIFTDQVKKALPHAPLKSEFLLCPVSRNAFVHTTQGGGLNEWMKKYQGEA